MPADKKLHNYLDEIFDSGEATFMEAADLMLRTLLRGAISSHHIKRFPESAEEAVKYVLLGRRKNRSLRKGKGQ